MDKQKLQDEIAGAEAVLMDMRVERKNIEAHLAEMKRQLAEIDQPGVERCELQIQFAPKNDELRYYRNGMWCKLSDAQDDPNFAGYEYEDGEVSSAPILWKQGTGYHAAARDGYNRIRPVAVLFAKQGA